MSIIYWGIWLFTQFQMASNKTCRIFNIFYKKYVVVHPHFIYIFDIINDPSTKFIENNVEFIKDGNVVWVTSLSKLLETEITISYDIIIVSKYESQENNCVNKQIFNNICDLKNEKTHTESSMNFISTTISDILVEFKTKQYNYYMDGNIWSPEFLVYFMKKYYNTNILSGEKIMQSFYIIDNAANVINGFNINTKIYIFKNTYDVKQ